MPSVSSMCRLSPIVLLNMDSEERPSINVIDALRANHNDLQEFVDSLAEDEWQMASACDCLLYTSPSPRDGLLSRMPSSA